MAWRTKRWADAVLQGPRAPEEEVPAPEAEQAPPAEPVPPAEAAPPEQRPPAEAGGPPEHWLRDVRALQRGPPADWVARVRKGAPHLLERMGLRYRLGQIPPEVAAALAAAERTEAEAEAATGEPPPVIPSREVPAPEDLEAGAPRTEPRPFVPMESPRPMSREVAPAPVSRVPRAEPAPERPTGAPVSRAPAPPPSSPAPGEAPARARAPRVEPAPAEAPAREPEAPRVARERAPRVSHAPLPPSVHRAAAMPPRPAPPISRALEPEPPAPEGVTPPTGGAVLAPAPPMAAESLAYRGTHASSREPTFRPQPVLRARTEVLRVDVPVPVPMLAEREAPVWPELPEAQVSESVDGAAMLREWERLRRLDREQRGG